MKNTSILLLLVLLTAGFLGCKKAATASISTSLLVGHWYIHHIYVRSYQNNVFIKDSTFHNLPQPNYVVFNGNGTLEYRYNSPTSEMGTYLLKGADSVYATIGGTSYKWKIDLLISTNFNVQETTYDSPIHGFDMETYQSFVK